MAVSARNQFKGTIKAIDQGSVNAIVHLQMPSGDVITSTISLEAVKELGLAPGKEAIAIIKATDVLVSTGGAKLSARNQFEGEVIGVNVGAVNDIVTIKTAVGDISATISAAAVKELELEAGAKAKAIIKATSVIIAV